MCHISPTTHNQIYATNIKSILKKNCQLGRWCSPFFSLSLFLANLHDQFFLTFVANPISLLIRLRSWGFRWAETIQPPCTVFGMGWGWDHWKSCRRWWAYDVVSASGFSTLIDIYFVFFLPLNICRDFDCLW